MTEVIQANSQITPRGTPAPRRSPSIPAADIYYKQTIGTKHHRAAARRLEPLWQEAARHTAELPREGQAPGNAANGSEPHILLAEHKRLPLAKRDGRYTFILPGVQDTVRIRFPRGVAIRSVEFRRGDEVVPVPMDHPALTEGWSPAERDGAAIWRYTDGDALLMSPLTGVIILEIETM